MIMEKTFILMGVIQEWRTPATLPIFFVWLFCVRMGWESENPIIWWTSLINTPINAEYFFIYSLFIEIVDIAFVGVSFSFLKCWRSCFTLLAMIVSLNGIFWMFFFCGFEWIIWRYWIDYFVIFNRHLITRSLTIVNFYRN